MNKFLTYLFYLYIIMINFIFRNSYIILIAIIVFLSLGLMKSCSDLRTAREVIENKESYISALEDNQQGIITTLNITRSELSNSKDSINVLLDSLVKAKKYTKTVVRAEYIQSDFLKVDSVLFSDVIFTDGVDFDTVIVDSKYYSCEIIGRYPNNLIITPHVKSELVLLSHIEKEYTGKPAKTKLGIALRKLPFSFLKKKWREKIVTDIEDLNPYIEVKKGRVNQIIENND